MDRIRVEIDVQNSVYGSFGEELQSAPARVIICRRPGNTVPAPVGLITSSAAEARDGEQARQS
jgi:hypothetical protein